MILSTKNLREISYIILGYTDPHIRGVVDYYLTSQPVCWAGGPYFVHNVPRIVTNDWAFVTYEIKALNIYQFI